MRFIALTLLLGLVSLGFAAPEPTKEAKEEKKRTSPNEVEVRFNNRSTVRMLILQEKLDIQTAYGKLSVPLAEVQKIEFGVHLPEATSKKIDEAIKQLGSETFKDRETAADDLVSIGALAFSAVKVASKSSDPEVSRNAEAVLKRIREKVPADDLNIKTNDVVQTIHFTIAGRIENSAIKARSEYFGDLQLKTADLRLIRWVAAGSGESTVTVDATKYGVAEEQWMDTGVTLSPETVVRIAASGQVDLRPDVAGRFMTGPAGSRRFGNNQGPPAGALLGRIGESGTTFVIGDKHETKPTAEGKLYLRIVPSPYEASTGGYTVKISTGN